MANKIQTNFASGQIDPTMKGRVDTVIYENGAETLINSSPLVTGGVRRRPGTEYLATLLGSTRLRRLQFNEEQLYIFAFSNARLDIYDDGGTLLQSLTGQPWDDTTRKEMTFTQQGDTTIICYKDFPMKKLVRTGATTFTMGDFEFEADSSGYPIYQPYFKFADNAVTITPSATTGSITLTTSADHWTEDHVGSYVRVSEKTCEITAYTSATVVTATVHETLAGTGAVTDWDENVFSAANGYARSAAFHGRRLWFGGTRDLSRHAFASKTGAFFNFDVGTGLDDESIQAEVAIDDIGEIHHTHSGRHLLFLSDTGIVFVPETDTSPVTPGTFNPRFQVPFGASTVVQPRRLDGASIYVQDTGKVGRELIFNDIQQAYTGDAVSLPANDQLDDVQDLGVLYGHSAGAEQFALFVNADGTIACYHTIRSEKIFGWFPWETDGEFESVVDLNNTIYAAVKRTIDGSTVYYLERFDFDLSVDCAKRFSGTETDTFTVAHLPNTSVYAVTDDRATSLGNKTTNGSGQATFDETADEVDVGLFYDRTILTLPPQITTQAGDMDGEIKRFGRVVLTVHESVSFAVDGTDFLVRQVTDDLSLPPTKSSTKHTFYPQGWSMSPQLRITQSEPLDFTLLSIWAEVNV
jgi:hypothetical protein